MQQNFGFGSQGPGQPPGGFAFGTPGQPAFGAVPQQQQQAPAFGFGQGGAPTLQGVAPPSAPPTAGLAFGGGPAAAPVAFGFGQQGAPSTAAVQTSFGFGQAPPQRFGAPAASAPAFGQPAAPPFGQQPQPQQAGGFSFGAAAPAAVAPFGQAAAAPGQVSFGAQSPPQQQPATSFAFGTAAPGGAQAPLPAAAFSFGAAPAAPPAAAAPGGFAFGQSTAAALSASAPSFDFGASLRQQQPAQQHAAQPAAPAPAAAAPEQVAGDDYEAMKRAALANMPSFGGGRGAVRPPTGGASRAGGRGRGGRGASPPPGFGSLQEDPEERARRLTRAARFAPTAAAVAAEPPAAPSVPAAQPGTAATYVPPALRAAGMAQPAAMQPAPARESFGGPVSVGGDGGEEGEGAAFGGEGRSAIVGTCEDMCPAAERERRQNMSDIQVFERVDPANASLTSPELAVRRFARTVDDPRPSDFRTRGALERTMAHLRGLLDRGDVRFGLVHKFVWDRYRSVRQDLYIQGITDPFAMGIFEEIVRFHVLCEHELCGEDQSVTDMEGFNSHLNMEQANKALISLSEMYNKAAAEGRPQTSEAEFRAYHLLSLMAQHGKFKGDQQAFLSMLQALRPEVRAAPPVQWVLRLQRAMASGNFVRFFLLAQEAPYLLACAAHVHFPAARARALRLLGETLSPSAARPAAMELSWLQRTLLLDSLEETRALCASHGFTEFTEELTGPAVLLYRGAYVDPPPPVARRPSDFIRAKAPPTRSAAVVSPATAPLSPQEVAAVRQRQQAEERRRAEAAAAARAAAEAAEARQRAAAEAAAAEEQRQREAAAEAQRHAQEAAQRAEAERLEGQRQREEAERAAREAAAREAAQRQAEAAAEVARRERAAQEAAAAAAAAAAAEAARMAEEERRRWAAEEAERRRLAALERQRKEEEARRREAERVAGVQRKYLRRWLQRALVLREERRRRERQAASLKACRVGVAPSRGVSQGIPSLQEAAQGLQGLNLAGGAQQAQRAALDLPALLAPLLAQRSPHTQALLWKVVLAAAGGGHSPNTIVAQQHTEQRALLQWLRLQLSGGSVAPSPSGSVHVQGPVSLSAGGATLDQELTTCVHLPAMTSTPLPPPPRAGASALAGASAVIVAAPPGASANCVQSVLQALPPLAPRLPVLVLLPGAEAAAAGELQSAIVEQQAGGAQRLVHVISISAAQRPAASRSAVYSTQELVQGLRWLAGNAPPQPALSIVRVEEAARDALTAALSPLLRASDRGAAAQADHTHDGANAGLVSERQRLQLFVAFHSALDCVADALQAAGSDPAAAWRWPPPELCDPDLRAWHSPAAREALLAALTALRAASPAALGIPAGATASQAAVSLHSRLGALAAQPQAVVLPPSPLAAFAAALAAAERAGTGNAGDAPLLLEGDGDDAAERDAIPQRLKRKWRHSPEGGAPAPGQGRPAGRKGAPPVTHDSLKAGLAALLAELPEERNLMNSFEAWAAAAAVVSSDEAGAAKHPAQVQEGAAAGGVGGSGPAAPVLQQLAEVREERRAAEGMWARMRHLASSAWLF